VSDRASPPSRRSAPSWRSERGSAAASALVVVALVALCVVVVAGCRVLAERGRVAGAADASALAAADVAAGLVAGSPCPRAAAAATANGTVLDSCVVAGHEATVRVSTVVSGVVVAASATAGPPPADDRSGPAPP